MDIGPLPVPKPGDWIRLPNGDMAQIPEPIEPDSFPDVQTALWEMWTGVRNSLETELDVGQKQVGPRPVPKSRQLPQPPPLPKLSQHLNYGPDPYGGGGYVRYDHDQAALDSYSDPSISTKDYWAGNYDNKHHSRYCMCPACKRHAMCKTQEAALATAQDTNGEVPQVRIGDAERNIALDNLAKHFEAGRLDQDEYEDRMNKALSAKTGNDITPLFADLPILERPHYPEFDKPRKQVRLPSPWAWGTLASAAMVGLAPTVINPPVGILALLFFVSFVGFIVCGIMWFCVATEDKEGKK